MKFTINDKVSVELNLIVGMTLLPMFTKIKGLILLFVSIVGFIILVLIGSEIVFRALKNNSDIFSVHRASLMCSYRDMNSEARVYYGDLQNSEAFIQLRDDWIRDRITLLEIGDNSENGLKRTRILEKKPNEYIEEKDSLEPGSFVRFAINRNTLVNRISMFDKTTKREILWLERQCVKIDKKAFEAQRSKSIKATKDKQKI